MFALKAASAVLILASSLLGMYLPSLLKKYQNRSLSLMRYGEWFAQGVFLAVSFLHLLPESLEQLSEAHPGLQHYPWIFLICLLSMIAIRAIEDAALFTIKSPNQLSQYTAHIALLSLSIHAFIEGAALGLASDVAHLGILFIAILSHKTAATFALAIQVKKSAMASQQQTRMMLLFACMTPLGIMSTSMIGHFTILSASATLQALCSAIAAGTFLAIASCHTVDSPVPLAQESVKIFWAKKWLSYLTAIAFIALFAQHDH